MKKALITGITGQDGSYLAELLLAKGYEIYGLVRPGSKFNRQGSDPIHKDLYEAAMRCHLEYGDVTQSEALTNLIYNIQPDEIYHLAAQSHVKESFEMPEYTADATGTSTTRILEAIRASGVKARFYQASSSEMFGKAPAPQSEQTPFQPRSPYAVAKLYAYWMVRIYRDSYSIFASNGILFNHESPRRGESFVTRKITCNLANILAGKQDKIHLGNLDAKRDWGYAPDFVAAMWKIMQLDHSDDFIIGTGETHSVREFLDEAFQYVGLDWHEYVVIDPKYFSHSEVDCLQADFRKAREVLGWEPRICFHDLVHIMVDADLELAGLQAPGEGKRILEQQHGSWHRWEDQVNGPIE